jgi:hypothetical protein
LSIRRTSPRSRRVFSRRTRSSSHRHGTCPTRGTCRRRATLSRLYWRAPSVDNLIGRRWQMLPMHERELSENVPRRG